MKKLLPLFTTLFFAITAVAQSGTPVTYQAVARDSFGTPLPNKILQLRFTIIADSSNGTTVYKETDSVTTNSLGLFATDIGLGTPVTGTYNSIDWSGGDKYLQVEVDPTGGTSFTDMGTSQLMSVPFAQYARKAAEATSAWVSTVFRELTLLPTLLALLMPLTLFLKFIIVMPA